MTGVVVEVDMLDSEKTPHRTPAAKVGSRGLTTLVFDKAYDAAPSSKLAKAYAKALETKEEDSEVQFVVYSHDKDGNDVELGIARCSLESIVNKGRDFDSALEVRNSKGTVLGELACSVGALAAFGKEEDKIKDDDAKPSANRRRGKSLIARKPLLTSW